jgi:hypothetical protein
MGTYVHLGRKAATIWASQEYSFPLKLASVILVVIVIACLSPKVSVDIALLSEGVLADIGRLGGDTRVLTCT